MEPKRAISILSFLLLTLTSCQDYINFVPPDSPEKLSIVGLLDADDTSRFIIFEKSFQYDYSYEFSDSLSNLSFNLSNKNTDINGSFESNSSRTKKIDISDDILFVSGDNYHLTASEDEVGQVDSDAIVPERPSDFSVDFEGTSSRYLEFNRICYNPLKSVILNLSLHPEKNFYYCILIKGTFTNPIDSKTESCYVGFNPQDNTMPGILTQLHGLYNHSLGACSNLFPFVSEIYKAYFFSSDNFSSDIFNLKISIDLNELLFDYKKPIFIKLCSISKDFYLFENSLFLYSKTIMDPFMEPVYIRGNVRGGNGIFTIYRSIEKPFQIPWEKIF
jgi:hypothetical protein